MVHATNSHVWSLFCLLLNGPNTGCLYHSLAQDVWCVQWCRKSSRGTVTRCLLWFAETHCVDNNELSFSATSLCWDVMQTSYGTVECSYQVLLIENTLLCILLLYILDTYFVAGKEILKTIFFITYSFFPAFVREILARKKILAEIPGELERYRGIFGIELLNVSLLHWLVMWMGSLFGPRMWKM